jgi:hypothetical protein
MSVIVSSSLVCLLGLERDSFNFVFSDYISCWRFTCRCRLGSRSRGYHSVTPRPIAAGPLCPLVPPVISRGAPHHVTWETPISERRNYGREMAGQFGLRFGLPRKSQGSFTCRKSATWDRRLYFISEGRLWPGSYPRSWVPEASGLTTRPPKPLHFTR